MFVRCTLPVIRYQAALGATVAAPFVIRAVRCVDLLIGFAAAPYQPISTKANRKNRKAGAGDLDLGLHDIRRPSTAKLPW